MKNNNKIMVERETYEKDGKTYYTYFIKGKVRGKEVRIAVTPPDKGGFTVLDIVFGNEMKADLITKPYEIKDDATGNVIKGNTYSVQSIDENGEVYECPSRWYSRGYCITGVSDYLSRGTIMDFEIQCNIWGFCCTSSFAFVGAIILVYCAYRCGNIICNAKCSTIFI